MCARAASRPIASVSVPLSIYLICTVQHLLLSVPVFSSPSADHHAKLILIDDASQRYELSGRQCHGGVFLTEPKKFKCACVFGVWGIYAKYCQKPIAIVAGQYECFKIPTNMNISQFIIFGNPDYPFEPVITHFREDYAIFTNFYASDMRDLELEPSAPFITITAHLWELESDTGDAICLAGGGSGSKKQFCYYHAEHWSEGQQKPWDLIVRIRKGCKASTPKQYSTNCVDIPVKTDFPREHGVEVCNGPEITLFPNDTKRYGPETTTEKMTSTTVATPLIDFPEFLSTTTSSTSPPPTNATEKVPASTTTPPPIVIDFPDPILTTPEPTTSTTTEETYPDTCATGLAREDVKAHWSSDEARDCPKGTSDAVFVDQLQRIVVGKMKKLFPERMKSLNQVQELVKLNFLLMSKTCPSEAVSLEFLEDVTEAFNVLIQEDFFYGVEELQPEVFKRFTTALQTCIKRATVFNISMPRSDCSEMEITGNLLKNGVQEKIEIPEDAGSSNYEPIIESAWKLFLNAHAYCYENFEPINDHHHFSTFFFSLFSESIYEKWNSPLESDALYKFVLPTVSRLALTMKNLDYCVGATSLTSSCQTWLQRTSPQPQPQAERQKRSAWDAHMGRSRDESRIWNGLGHCLHSPEEPAFKLGYAKCPHPVK